MIKRLVLISVVLVVALAAVSLSPLVQAQDQPDDAQATIDALVQQRFQQTLEAAGPEQSATAAAQATLDFNATLDAAFGQALTATAQAGGGSLPLPTATALPADAQTGEGVPVDSLRVTLQIEGNPEDEAIEDAEDAIDDRLRALGVENYDVQWEQDENEIRVRIESPVDAQQIVEVIARPGLLEFVDFSGLGGRLAEFEGQQIATSGFEDWLENADLEDDDATGLRNPLTDADFETVVTSEDIERAEAQQLEQTGEWAVVFEFDEEGGQAMLDFSREHIGEPLAITLDGVVLSIPVIQSEFGTAGGLISGSFDQAAAEQLALQLNIGVVPVLLSVSALETLDGDRVRVAQAETAPNATSTPRFTPTPDPRPTMTRGEIQIAEQVFENGRMFWVQPTGQLWVMIVTGEGEGTWGVYEDTFVDGEPETDPSIVPPDGFFQPERGFGKLWRGNDEVREALGWAITPEFGYVSDYYYQPGGELQDETFVPGPGYHVLFTLYNEAIQFNEADNTWSLYTGDE